MRAERGRRYFLGKLRFSSGRRLNMDGIKENTANAISHKSGLNVEHDVSEFKRRRNRIYAYSRYIRTKNNSTIIIAISHPACDFAKQHVESFQYLPVSRV